MGLISRVSSRTYRSEMTTTYTKLHTEPQAHDEEIWDCKWLSDKNIVLTASLDDKVNMWKFDDETNKLSKLTSLDRHNLGVNSIDISPDNKIIATRSLDSFIRFFSIDDNNEQGQNIDCAPANSWTIEFFPNGKYIATGSMTGHVHIMRTEDAEKVLTLETQLNFVMSLSTSPNGQYLAASGMDGKVVIFEIKEDEMENKLVGNIKFSFDAHQMTVRAICFTNDSRNIITGSDDSLIRIYSLDGKAATLLDTMCGHGGWILSLRRSLDKRHIVSTSADNKLKIWDLLTRDCVYTFSEHSGKCWAAAFNSEGNKLASVSSDKSL